MDDVEDFTRLVKAALEQSTFPELTAVLPTISEFKWHTLRSLLETHAELVQFARKGVRTQTREDQTMWENGVVKYYITSADLGYVHLITYPQARNQEEYRVYVIYKDSIIERATEYDYFAKQSVHYHVSTMGIEVEVHPSPYFSVKISPDLIKIIVEAVDYSYVVILDRVSRRVTVERVTDLYVGD